MKEEDDGVFFFSRKREKNTKKRKKKCRERRELTFLLLLLHLRRSTFLAFSSPRSFNHELSTFLKACVSRLFEALCYSNSRVFPSSGDGMSEK